MPFPIDNNDVSIGFIEKHFRKRAFVWSEDYFLSILNAPIQVRRVLVRNRPEKSWHGTLSSGATEISNLPDAGCEMRFDTNDSSHRTGKRHALTCRRSSESRIP